MSRHPIFYSFRRCPFAIRARLVLYACHITCELREVVLRDKPQEMIAISAKATVPVLQLPNGEVIDESLDIMIWATAQNDPHHWQPNLEEMCALVKINDHQFKIHLDKYKYPDQNPELSQEEHRENGDFFLGHLDSILGEKDFLSGDRQTITDLAIFPFIRQFAFVDKDYFDELPYSHLQRWLDFHLQSELFNNVMKKYTRWEAGQEIVYFP